MRRQTINIERVTCKNDWKRGVRLQIIPQGTEWTNGEPVRVVDIVLDDAFVANSMMKTARTALETYREIARRKLDMIDEMLK